MTSKQAVDHPRQHPWHVAVAPLRRGHRPRPPEARAWARRRGRTKRYPPGFGAISRGWSPNPDSLPCAITAVARYLDAWLAGRRLDRGRDAGRLPRRVPRAGRAPCGWLLRASGARLVGVPSPAGERTDRVLAGYRRNLGRSPRHLPPAAASLSHQLEPKCVNRTSRPTTHTYPVVVPILDRYGGPFILATTIPHN